MSSTTRTGRIYRIIHKQSDICYVGSTFNRLSDRWSQHKCVFNRWVADKTRDKCSVYPHIEEHGIDQFQIMLVKEYPVVDREHLEAYETLWIKKLRCVNKNSPFQIPKLYKAAYHAANRDKIAARKNVKHECSCGGRYTVSNKRQHERSPKHQRWVESQ